MKKIGIISDTHNYLDPKFLDFFEPCDLIIHAGDIGSLEIADKLSKFKKLIAVSGNIDDYNTKLQYPLEQRFKIEEVEIYLTHIGGFPGKYSQKSKKILESNPPQIFICGHSHILRVMYDKKYDTLVINPGAAGQYGIQPKKTAIRLKIDGKEIKDLEICELNR
ncbi:MAG: metallophosphatase family protein [Bacteroidales bacterium]|nr:metallophosphatase family protein [Bacteroidales bacterium]